MLPSCRIECAFIALLATIAACGDESDTVTPPPGPDAPTCVAPNRPVGSECREPGVQDDGCAAGSFGLDGACRAAGIPSGSCADGFAHDGDVGCEAILPPSACAPATMAVPGDTACRPVMQCADGTWGGIRVDSATEHVDGSYAGADSDGSEQKPWATIAAAIAAAAPGATIAVAAGLYPEDVRIEGKPVVLWGVCPDQVEIAGAGASLGAVDIRTGADGTIVRGVSVTGPSFGIAVSGSERVLIDRARVHDTGQRGAGVTGILGPTQCTIRGSLFDDNSEVGIFVGSSDVTVESTVVARSVPLQGALGRGMNVQANDYDRPATVVVRGSLLEDNSEFGIWIYGSTATIEGSVVRGTLPDADGAFGRGIDVLANDSTGVPASATVRGSLIDRNYGVGVLVQGSQATLETTVVRGTLGYEDGKFGRGIAFQPAAGVGTPSVATVRSCLVEENTDVGVLVAGSDATLEGTVVRRTKPRPDGLYGRGVNFQPAPGSEAPSTGTVRGCVIDENADTGVYVGASSLTMDGTVVSRTASDALGGFGRGVGVEADEKTLAPSTAIVRGSVVNQNRDVGVTAVASNVTIAGSLVRDTRARDDGLFGDGMSAVAAGAPASLTVDATLVEGSARASIASFGALVSIGATTLQCSAFDLEGEPFGGASFTFDDRGANACGCPPAAEACLAVSAGLAPPPPSNQIE